LSCTPVPSGFKGNIREPEGTLVAGALHASADLKIRGYFLKNQQNPAVILILSFTEDALSCKIILHQKTDTERG